MEQNILSMLMASVIQSHQGHDYKHILASQRARNCLWMSARTQHIADDTKGKHAKKQRWSDQLPKGEVQVYSQKAFRSKKDINYSMCNWLTEVGAAHKCIQLNERLTYRPVSIMGSHFGLVSKRATMPFHSPRNANDGENSHKLHDEVPGVHTSVRAHPESDINEVVHTNAGERKDNVIQSDAHSHRRQNRLPGTYIHTQFYTVIHTQEAKQITWH